MLDEEPSEPEETQRDVVEPRFPPLEPHGAPARGPGSGPRARGRLFPGRSRCTGRCAGRGQHRAAPRVRGASRFGVAPRVHRVGQLAPRGQRRPPEPHGAGGRRGCERAGLRPTHPNERARRSVAVGARLRHPRTRGHDGAPRAGAPGARALHRLRASGSCAHRARCGPARGPARSRRRAPRLERSRSRSSLLDASHHDARRAR
jgi:hypothetical protein